MSCCDFFRSETATQMLKEEDRIVKVFASRMANSTWSLDVFLTLKGSFFQQKSSGYCSDGLSGGGDCAPLGYFCSRCF